jgi:hypothetical protein
MLVGRGVGFGTGDADCGVGDAGCGVGESDSVGATVECDVTLGTGVGLEARAG